MYVALVIFGIIVAICWIVLPFAPLGTKPLLRELIAEVKWRCPDDYYRRADGSDGTVRFPFDDFATLHLLALTASVDLPSNAPVTPAGA